LPRRIWAEPRGIGEAPSKAEPFDISASSLLLSDQSQRTTGFQYNDHLIGDYVAHASALWLGAKKKKAGMPRSHGHGLSVRLNREGPS
jgi:hypothetical protein